MADGSKTIPAENQTITLVPTIEGDLLYEGNETFTITLSNISNATDGITVHTVTITDNDDVPTIGCKRG